ncbi:MAG TPA: DegT/DnrJ/EryC1/StrS family aminotransferase [Opitutaceae bacterium]|nr:DegT/DnrJ/EryC1/StrS family aminotransferase [Opitutaceae bacterium]
MNHSHPIYVTQPYLPPLQEFVPYLEQIWANKWLTNAGPFHNELEVALARHLEVPHLSLFANGTIALVVALQALRISGEVITTPFTFVATTHSLLWNGIKPVFVDIDPRTFNLDPNMIEAAITPQTTAIMPVHCYGNPCDVARIEAIADRYGLKVIYDAAHAFGVRQQGESIARHGDLTVLSFHATKTYNTFEGGAIVSPDAKTKQRIDFLKNFGIADEVTVVGPGINGKMNEVQAAFGLLQLKHLPDGLEKRRAVDQRYREALAGIPGLSVPVAPEGVSGNYSYFLVLVGPEFRMSRDALFNRLRAAGIFARRYFHPLVSQMPMYRGLPSAAPEHLPVATRIAQEVLCLPIHAELDEAQQARVINLVREA